MTYLFPDIESWSMTGENMAGGAAQGKKNIVLINKTYRNKPIESKAFSSSERLQNPHSLFIICRWLNGTNRSCPVWPC